MTFAEPSIVNYKYSKFTIFIEKLKKQMDIKTIIKNKGHISISELMGYALPIYYGSRQPFGKGGDFKPPLKYRRCSVSLSGCL